MKNFLFTFLICFFFVTVQAQNQANLRLNLEKNKIYRLRSFDGQSVSQTINGNQQTTEVKISNTISLKVIDAAADYLVAEVHIDTMLTETNAMGKTYKFSSANEGNIKSTEMNDVISSVMNKLSKNALFVKLDYTGKPLQVINVKMLSDMILKDTSLITLNAQLAPAAKKQLVGIVSEDALKNLIGAFTWHLPGKSVAVKDHWSIGQQINSSGMNLEISTNYSLDAINGDNASVSAESTIKPSAGAKPIESAGAKVTYDDLGGMSKSTLVINTSTGLVTGSTNKSHITGNLGISGPGFSMQMPMDINGESKSSAVQ